MCGESCDAQRPYYMYVAECADGTLYTGYARDVEARIAQHNAGTGAKYTRSRGPVRLAACAAFATQHEALSAECRFKRLTRAQKLALIAQAACAGTAPEDTAAETGERGACVPPGTGGDWTEDRTRAFARILSEAFPLRPDADPANDADGPRDAAGAAPAPDQSAGSSAGSASTGA